MDTNGMGHLTQTPWASTHLLLAPVQTAQANVVIDRFHETTSSGINGGCLIFLFPNLLHNVSLMANVIKKGEGCERCPSSSNCLLSSQLSCWNMLTVLKYWSNCEWNCVVCPVYIISLPLAKRQKESCQTQCRRSSWREKPWQMPPPSPR